MRRYGGQSVFGGVAIGNISIYSKKHSQVQCNHCHDTAMEKKRFDEARDEAKGQLQNIYKKALTEAGRQCAEIFEAHEAILDDEEYLNSVYDIIDRQEVNAEYAVSCASHSFVSMFEAMDDEYMKARAVDIKDISERIIGILTGHIGENIYNGQGVIVVADDLTPSETIQMDKSRIVAFVTRYGSANSHTAILARTMNIPALVSVDFPEDIDGRLAIVDGHKGQLIVEPDGETLDSYRKIQNKDMEKRQLLGKLKGMDNVTRDGRRIELCANIADVEDAVKALDNDADGIGLFRSEFLYLRADDYPTEEQQFNAYRSVAELMVGKRVIIRTLDIGADKQAGYFGLEPEENPAMGLRAIRLCLQRKDIFKTQLRAIFRASAYGNISVMFPMIISVSEVKNIKEIVNQIKIELDEEGISYGSVELGVMIETPAAAIISDELAEEVDFFSIGTNDLTQYTLAIDRQNQKLSDFYDAHHPAILRMIEMVVKNGHAHNCKVGICGELAADYTLTERFINMGVDELSVSPSLILGLRERIRSI